MTATDSGEGVREGAEKIPAVPAVEKSILTRWLDVDSRSRRVVVACGIYAACLVVFAILAGPQHQVPVIGQDRVAQQPHGRPLPSLADDFLEGGVVGRLAEQGGPADRPIEDVVDIAGIRASRPSRHSQTVPSR